MSVTPGARLVRLGTRASRLARLQTTQVSRALLRANPGLTAEEEVFCTAGDRDERTPLPEIGGKGVFTQELEEALRDGRIDLAVHSLKDVPVEASYGLTLGAVGMREDPREVLISAHGWTLDRLPPGAAVGTCSTRRAAQLLAVRPDLELRPLRGNVDTRVEQAMSGRFDAIILAAAGVHRLGLSHAITEYLPTARMLPAPGQGALAVQCRADDHELLDLLRPLDDPEVRAATDAERGFLAGLGGGCTAPIAALAVVDDRRLYLDGLVASSDGQRILRLSADGPVAEAWGLGLSLAVELRGRGAEVPLP